MGFFDDMLDEGMRDTRRVMADTGLSYGEAYKVVTNQTPAPRQKCRYCRGSGDSYFGSHCGACGGSGYVDGAEASRQTADLKND